jgi:hypothetical protein
MNFYSINILKLKRMKELKLLMSLALVTIMFTQCEKDEVSDVIPNGNLKSGKGPPKGTFTVTIENVSETYDFFESGVFNTPDGADSPGPLLPGNSYSFTFHASIGHKLTFATMFVKSNDLFYGPSGVGIDLFDNLFEGEKTETIDITSMVYLWDAGTEVNQEPGTGPDQPLNGGPGTGTDEGGNVMMVNDAFTYPDVDQTIKVALEYDGISEFTLTIENLPDSFTPLAPGVWVTHTNNYALYHDGMPDYGHGLEALAEDGMPGTLGGYLAMNSGYVSPLAPGVWVIHNRSKVLFDEGKTDHGDGLEALAEDGDPSGLASWLASQGYQSGVFNTPLGAAGPGPLMPGQSYSFSFDAKGGEYLSFATMLVHTNDLFYAPSERGIRLFNGNLAAEGSITTEIKLWDAGTEVNEYPGAGIHQPARLNGGVDENGVVMMVDDEYTYPAINQVIEVNITRN